ncbi:MAG: carbonic anhydrase [Candidatus Rokuibacteriota bacterium]
MPVSRRRFLIRGTAAGAAALVGGVPWTGRLARATAQTALTPDEALKRLLEGNKHFTAGRLTSVQEDLRRLKQKTAGKQEPFAAVLACADSRVPVEILFDQSIGHVFVTRVAGNVATAEIIGSLEYGVAVLGARIVMVLGHRACGAVSAAISGKAVPGQISTLFRYIRPAIDEAGSDVEAAIRANARIQARLLKESSPVFAAAIGKGHLKVVAAYYDVATGAVTMLDQA